MDILSHTLSGTAIGTVVAAHSGSSFRGKAAIIFFATLGGALPDLDAISYWSKFDSTIGALFGLSHSGKVIYGAKFWYSHHAALHSLSAAFGLPLLFLLLKAVWLSMRQKKLSTLSTSLKKGMVSALAFALGFCMHLLEDMPTPASVWGGVNLFWPAETYVGGFGKIWWWNNYDIFLLICTVIVINLMLLSLKRWMNFRLQLTTKIVFGLGVGIALYQMNTRPIDFSYSGHTNQYDAFETQSKQVQKDLLGKDLYEFMNSLDNAIPLNF